jgi:two-component sensor histidine kinase
MAETLARWDWNDSPIGAPEHWPPLLKTTVGLTLPSHFPNCVFWGPELVMIPNAAYMPLAGDKDVIGRPVPDAWAEVWPDIQPIAEKALAGEASFLEDMPLTIDRGNGPEQAYFTFCYSPIRDLDGSIHGVLDTVIETTGKVHAEQRLRIANQELAHRMKNALTVFQAITSQTFASELPRAEVKARLEQRLSALGAAHDLLLCGDVPEARIGDVVTRSMKALLMDPSSVMAGGPPVVLDGRRALSLALGVHELATNALKYGALSVPGGKVTISWSNDDDGFWFEWIESGGPAVVAPDRRGFGSRLIERVLAVDFGGASRLEFAAGGARFSLNGAPIRSAQAA